MSKKKRRNKRNKGVRISKAAFRQIYTSTRGVCYLCLRPVPLGATVLTKNLYEIPVQAVDHIVPLSKKGETRASNLAVVHTWCNTQKSNMTLDEIPSPSDFSDGIPLYEKVFYERLFHAP